MRFSLKVEHAPLPSLALDMQLAVAAAHKRRFSLEADLRLLRAACVKAMPMFTEPRWVAEGLWVRLAHAVASPAVKPTP